MCPFCKEWFVETYISWHLRICENQNNTLNDSANDSISFEDDQVLLEQENAGATRQHSSEMTSDKAQSDDERHVSDNEISEDDFNSIVNELYQDNLDLSINVEQSNKPEFVTWICMFISLWQYVFNITDTAIEILIKFLKVIFNMLSINIHSLRDIPIMFPSSLYMFHNYLGYERDCYTKYVVCTKCYQLYGLEDAQMMIRGKRYSRKCSNILFPDHPNKRYRKECGQTFMQEVKASSGKKTLVPLKSYIYKYFKKSLSELIATEDFEKNCDLWKERVYHDGVYSDVFDGREWKKFSDFLNKERSYGLMLNVDWFCPYHHVKSISIGVIYLVCLNLPRSERFKRKNVILVGVIPSMKKEPATNSFLKPLIDELQTACNEGFSIRSGLDEQVHKFKAALICVGCDIPATRKVSGFLGEIFSSFSEGYFNFVSMMSL